jgi:hypothetical protein
MQIEIGDVSQKRLREINHLTEKECQAALVAAAKAKLEREGKTLDEIDHDATARRVAGFSRERIARACERVRKGLSEPVEKSGLTGKTFVFNLGYNGHFRVLGELPGYSDWLVAVGTLSGEYKFIKKDEAVLR